MKSRSAVVQLATSWIGKKESNGTHKEIIDIYNSFRPLPRNAKMLYTSPWCACTWSALAIKLGYTDIMPIEISCGYLIEAAKKMGIWQENDNYVPSPGDAVLYDWNDNGIGDNTGWPDHVGTVDYVNTSSGYFTVIEGNYSDSVKKRTVSINGKFIRGFITPKYEDNKIEMAKPSSTLNDTKKDIVTIAREVIAGVWGNGENRKTSITNAGYNYSEVQNAVNQILNTPSKSTTPSVVSTCKPVVKGDKSVNGKYKTTANLYCRNDAGNNKKALCLIPSNTEVICDGSYTIFNGVKWLYITVKVNGITYTGFSSSSYLRKQ